MSDRLRPGKSVIIGGLVHACACVDGTPDGVDIARMRCGIALTMSHYLPQPTLAAITCLWCAGRRARC